MTSVPRRLALVVALALASGGLAGSQEGATSLPPDELDVPEGYEVRALVAGLDFPSSIAWDDEGTAYVATSGFAYGVNRTYPAQVLRLGEDGNLTVVADGFDPPLTDVTWHDGRLYVAHRGVVSVLEEAGGNWTKRDLVTGLPAFGDHHTNEVVVGPDGRVYVGQGTATNSAVVGLDNLHMGWQENITEASDVPCENVTLAGVNYRTDDPWRGASLRHHFERAERVVYETPEEARDAANETQGSNVTTGAYVPFGTPTWRGQVVEGRVPCNGAVLAFEPDGSGLDWYAWGLRNPYGLKFGPDGTLWVAENLYDTRGSRPLHHTADLFRPVEEGGWYGFPDYYVDVPMDDPTFGLPNGTPPVLVLLEPPPAGPPPAQQGVRLEHHMGATKFDFARGGGAWGNASTVYLAAFGDMTPVTGLPGEHYGMAVVRFEAENASSPQVFLAAKDRFGGDFRPVEAAFGPDGDLYVVHIGAIPVVAPGGDAPPHPVPMAGTGAVYAVRAAAADGDVADDAPYGEGPVEDGAQEAEGGQTPAIGPVALALAAAAVALLRRRGGGGRDAR